VLSHARIWAAIDQLAERSDLSPSALARRAGLDPTTFNRSKRVARDGRKRWPSTESLAKILEATRTDLSVFLGILNGERSGREGPFRHVPLLGLARAGAGGFFDDGGFPAGQGFDQIAVPDRQADGAYALEVTGDSMMPLYRDGDIIIVSPNMPVRKGDRVVVKTKEGEVMAKILQRKTAKAVDLLSLNPDHPVRTVPAGEIEWMARIIWASQ
jgi:phage repressor protein C with HTH and peptisase S24 domain